MDTSLPREGESFEGPSKTLTDAHFLFFSALTRDVHPIHYDVEYAKTTRFCRVKTSLLNQRDEVLIEGFHLYRVLQACCARTP